MQIGIPAEVRPGETRVAATPETVKKLAASGHHKVVVQAGAGVGASGLAVEWVAGGARAAAMAAVISRDSGSASRRRGP